MERIYKLPPLPTNRLFIHNNIFCWGDVLKLYPLRKRLLFKPYFRGYTGRILLIEVKTFFKLVWITFSFVLTALPFTKIRYYLLVVTVINVFVCHL